MQQISFISTTSSELGSHRYRISMPITLLARHQGYFPQLHKFPTGREHVAIFSKHFNMLDYSYAKFVKANGGKVIFDICDYHADTTALWNHYTRMYNVADVVTFSSPYLQKQFMVEYGEAEGNWKPNYVIPDPMLMARQPIKPAKPKSNPNMLWYGQAPSLNPLKEHIKKLPPGNLVVMCDRFPEWLGDYCGHVQPVQWSEAALAEQLKNCDIILLPQSADLKTACKSNNRLLEAINAGRPVAASPIPAYTEFEKYVFVGPDIADMVNLYLDTPHSVVRQRLLDAQQLIDRRYGLDSVRESWVTAIERSLQ